MLWIGLAISLFFDLSTRMVRARKSRQAAKKKTAEPNILDEISGSDVSIPSRGYSQCTFTDRGGWVVAEL